MPSSVYPDIGDTLDNFYETGSDGHPEYFFHQSYGKDDFLYCLVPAKKWQHPTLGEIDCETTFFGPKVLNIFIAQKPYGWEGEEFVWGDPSSDYSKKVSDFLEQLAKVYTRFAYYHTIIYADTFTSGSLECEDVAEKMSQTIAKLQELATSTEGFEWGGIIDTQVPSSFFRDKIDTFYGHPMYKIEEFV